ncbi:MAG: 3-deoxy-D-manno-octulosonic acid transferase [Luteolibacter sp.]
MRWFAALMVYRILLPFLFVAAFPGWLVKMLRRDGFGTRLGERAAIYLEPVEFEPSGAVHVHAVSVGEVMLALKLIRAWLERAPERRFVLATGTATGHAVAAAAEIPGLRVTYAPLDFHSMVRRYLDRFEPERIVLVEGEAWPHLIMACRRRGIPVSLVNARMSPRSARRHRKGAAWLRPLFRMLDAVAVQEAEDSEIWKLLGVEPERIHHTGSLKFDPAGGTPPTKRDEFQEMIDAFGENRRVVLAASTHPGEDAWIATAIREAAPDALPVIVPRHAERRDEVRAELEKAGFGVVLRSVFHTPAENALLVVDSTGELRDWTAHADVVVIGKSFLATGGQNPAEAILARKPLVCGPHMENFEPLASRLVASGGCLVAENRDQLRDAIRRALDPATAGTMCDKAVKVLATHEGATRRILRLLGMQNHG